MNLLSFLDFFTYIVISSHFAPLRGLLGAFRGPGSLMGPPRAPIGSLISIATLIPGLVQPRVQLGKFAHFWDLPKQQCQSQS